MAERRQIERLLDDTLARAAGGDKEALGHIREMCRAEPATMASLGNLAHQVELAWRKMMYRDDASRLLVQVGSDELRRELLQDGDSPLERLLVDRVVATHLEVAYAARQVAVGHDEGMPLSLAEHRQNHLDRAQKRHLASIKALAQIRRLQVPILIGQLNVAQQQVNQVVPERAA